jgi:iron complex transport system substrate-binding protein
VATTAQARKQPWFRHLYPRIDQVPAAFDEADDVNMETLLGSRPDVVLMAYRGALPKWLAAADAYRIPVVMMPNTSLADLKTTALMTGAVLGPHESQIAAEFVRSFDDNIRKVAARTTNLPPDQRVRVLHTATAGVFTVDGQGTVADDWIRLAGGINAATVAGNARAVTMEQIAAWNPDVIIVGTAPNRESRNAILHDSRWRQINAVKNRRVFVNPTGVYLWDRHSAEAALQILWAAKVIHPDRFADLDVGLETKRFYARFFHHTLTDAELASIMNATAP